MVAGSEAEAAQGEVWALRAARVFDGETLHEDFPLVVIDGWRIATIERTAARPSDDLRVLDLGDATLLPGLIDAHVHLERQPRSQVAKRHERDGQPALLGDCHLP